MIKEYTKIERNYLIEQRVTETIERCGSIQNAIDHCQSQLKECLDDWHNYSYDCVGHSITCNTLLITRLEEKLNIK